MRTTKMMHCLRYCAAIAVVFAATVCSAQETETEQQVETKSKSELRAEEKRMNRVHKTQSPVQGFETVDMFDAMASGEIEVIVKAKSSAEANFIVKNVSDRHLAIQMPPAFATVPVMKQVGGGGFGGNQGGGGFGGGGFGGGGNRGGGGGGIFNIPPERDGKVAVNIFCLEHGKPDPRARMDYTVAPIETLSTDPAIVEICKMVANDEITQNVAQGAAWNVANGLSWEFLLVKNRIERMDGSYERYFTRDELLISHQVVAAAQERAEANAETRTRNRQQSEGEAIDRRRGE